jgi:hypothetical protein
MEPKLQMAGDSYQIVVGSEESGWAGFGEPIDCQLAGGRYVALVDLKDGEEDAVSLLDAWVYRVDRAWEDAAVIEEVDDEGDEGEEGDEGDEEETVA